MTSAGVAGGKLVVRRDLEAQEPSSNPHRHLEGLVPVPGRVQGSSPFLEELARWGIKVVASCSETQKEYAATYFPGIGCPREGLILKSGEISLEVPAETSFLSRLRKQPPYQFRVSIYTPDDNPKMPQTDFSVYMRSPAGACRPLSAGSIQEGLEIAKHALIAHHLLKGKRPMVEKIPGELFELGSAPRDKLSRGAAAMEIYLSTLVKTRLSAANNQNFSYETTGSVRTSIAEGSGLSQASVSAHFDFEPIKGEFAYLLSSASPPSVGRLSLTFQDSGVSRDYHLPVEIRLKTAAGVFQARAHTEKELTAIVSALGRGIQGAFF